MSWESGGTPVSEGWNDACLFHGTIWSNLNPWQLAGRDSIWCNQEIAPNELEILQKEFGKHIMLIAVILSHYFAFYEVVQERDALRKKKKIKNRPVHKYD